jgi:multiple sugar transport system permease protein
MASTSTRIKAKEKQAERSVQKRMHPALERKENIAGYLFLLPWFLGLTIFMVGPVVASLYLSFTNYNLLGAPQWTGIQNYLTMFTNADWRDAVRVTFVYVVVSVPLKLIFALLLAMLLKEGLQGLGLFRAVYYVPSLLGGSVAIALLWRKLFDSDGVANQVFSLVGIHATTSWISTPSTAIYTLIILAIWQFGSPMLIFLAGLKQIPREYYEAASTDGAGIFRKFFTITLPMITPILFFNLILQMVGAFQAFTPAYIVSGGTGGPDNATLFYTLLVYREGFGYLHMGYASAMAWFLLLIIAIFTSLAFMTSRYWVFYADEKG